MEPRFKPRAAWLLQWKDEQMMDAGGREEERDGTMEGWRVDGGWWVDGWMEG